MAKRYTEKEKQQILEKYKISPLSKLEFVKEAQISKATLNVWLRTNKPVKFVEAEISECKFEKNGEISIKHGDFVVNIPENIDFTVLLEVLKVVKSV